MPKGTGAAKITVSKNGPYLVEGAVPIAKQTIVADREGAQRGARQGLGRCIRFEAVAADYVDGQAGPVDRDRFAKRERLVCKR